MVTARELEEMARTPGERIAAAADDPSRGAAVYAEIEQMWRGFVGLLAEWAELTRAWLGDDAPAAAPWQGEEPPRERIERAFAVGDRDGALAAWEQAERAMREAVRHRCEEIDDLLAHVHASRGEEGLEAAMLHAAERGFWGEALPRQAEEDALTRTRELALFLTAGAFCTIEVSEDAERFTIAKHDCHCGRLIGDARRGGRELNVVPGPSPLTYGLPAVTPYQSHFAAIHGIWAIDRIGQPIPAFDCRGIEGCGAVCGVQVYKDAALVPRRYYEALGR